MSKQAVGEHIRYLTGHGYLTVSSHPDDRRAKTVALTERGWEALDLGERVIAGYDTWLATAVGVDRSWRCGRPCSGSSPRRVARSRIGGRRRLPREPHPRGAVTHHDFVA